MFPRSSCGSELWHGFFIGPCFPTSLHRAVDRLDASTATPEVTQQPNSSCMSATPLPFRGAWWRHLGELKQTVYAFALKGMFIQLGFSGVWTENIISTGSFHLEGESRVRTQDSEPHLCLQLLVSRQAASHPVPTYPQTNNRRTTPGKTWLSSSQKKKYQYWYVKCLTSVRIKT